MTDLVPHSPSLPALRDQVGEERFQVLCHLVDLQNHVADAWREYIVSDGEMSGVYMHLADARRALDKLADSEGGVSSD